MGSQLHLFGDISEDLMLRQDRAMGRKDGRACCFGAVEETPYRKGIGAEHEKERAKLEGERTRVESAQRADVACAAVELATAAEYREKAETKAALAEFQRKQGRERQKRLVWRGDHIFDFGVHWADAREFEQQAVHRAADAEREQRMWQNAEVVARRKLQECIERRDNWLRFYDTELRNLEIRTSDRFRQYDLGYRETHPHLPPWL
jgi:hypothetical protein